MQKLSQKTATETRFLGGREQYLDVLVND